MCFVFIIIIIIIIIVLFVYFFKNLPQFLHRVIPTDVISDSHNSTMSVIVYMQITYAYNVR
jgi:hypothetical protein